MIFILGNKFFFFTFFVNTNNKYLVQNLTIVFYNFLNHPNSFFVSSTILVLKFKEKRIKSNNIIR